MNNHSPILGCKYEILDSKGSVIKSRIMDNKKAFNVKLGMDIKRNNGSIEKIDVPFESYVGNYAHILQAIFSSTYDNTGLIKNTGDVANVGSIFKMDVMEEAPVSPADSSYGIWVGDSGGLNLLNSVPASGINRVLNFDDYSIRNRIHNKGYTAGGVVDSNLAYGDVLLSYPTANSFRVQRSFSNDNASKDLVIDEIGLVGLSGTDHVLIARDNYSPRIDLVAGETVTVYYEFSVASGDSFTRNYLGLLLSKFTSGVPERYLVDFNGNNSNVDLSDLQTKTKVADAGLDVITHGLTVSRVADIAEQALELDPGEYRYDVYTASNIEHSIMTTWALVQENNITVSTYSRQFKNVSTGILKVAQANLLMEDTVGNGKYLLGQVALVDNVATETIELQIDQSIRVILALNFPLV